MNGVEPLQIEFISTDKIPAGLNQEIDKLDQLAFHSQKENEDPELASIDWSSHIDTMALGRVEERLVTMLGLLRREILVGGKPVWVVGVSGVATHPDWQKRGFSSSLLQAAEKYMRQKMDAAFGLLVCSDERRAFYERLGWRNVADEFYFVQNGEQRSLKSSVMILPLAGKNWPSGKIDLCGLPW